MIIALMTGPRSLVLKNEEPRVYDDILFHSTHTNFLWWKFLCIFSIQFFVLVSTSALQLTKPVMTTGLGFFPGILAHFFALHRCRQIAG